MTMAGAESEHELATRVRTPDFVAQPISDACGIDHHGYSMRRTSFEKFVFHSPRGRFRRL